MKTKLSEEDAEEIQLAFAGATAHLDTVADILSEQSDLGPHARDAQEELAWAARQTQLALARLSEKLSRLQGEE